MYIYMYMCVCEKYLFLNGKAMFIFEAKLVSKSPTSTNFSLPTCSFLVA